ncbi:MAG TPA: hypothetical protein VGF76_07130 [Polyangiaceae bacterium]
MFVALAVVGLAQVGTFSVTGQQAVTASAAAVAYPAGLAVACFKAPSANSATVYVGNSAVTTSTGYPLAASESVCVPVQGKAGAVYVVAASTGSSIAWFGTAQ